MKPILLKNTENSQVPPPFFETESYQQLTNNSKVVSYVYGINSFKLYISLYI